LRASCGDSGRTWDCSFRYAILERARSVGDEVTMRNVDRGGGGGDDGVMGYGIVMMGGVMMYDVVVWLREMCT
jgi:hypothetical protein